MTQIRPPRTTGAQPRFELRSGPHGSSSRLRPLQSEPRPTAHRLPPIPHRAGAFLKPQPGEARRDSQVVERKGAGNSLGAGRGSLRKPGGVTVLCLSGLGWSDKLGDHGSETVVLEEAGCDGGRPM